MVGILPTVVCLVLFGPYQGSVSNNVVIIFFVERIDDHLGCMLFVSVKSALLASTNRVLILCCLDVLRMGFLQVEQVIVRDVLFILLPF